MLPAFAGSIPHVAPPPAARRRLISWSPSPAGPYQLPRDVLERLTVALRDRRNRDAALALALFLARFWSSPARLTHAFPIDRRALTDHPVLGLTEARVRGAIAALEAVGFLDREAVQGSSYKATDAGLHRKPIRFRFGAGYREVFARANARSKASRGVSASERRTISSTSSSTRPETSPTQLAQKQRPPGKGMIMGEQGSLDSGLGAALARLGMAIEGVKRDG